MEQTLATQMFGPEDAMPCHLTIDYEDREWRETQYPESAICAGSLAFLANECVGMHHPVMAEAVEAVGQRDDVFQWWWQFLQYHHGEQTETPLDRWMRIGPRIAIKTENGYVSLDAVKEDEAA
jgi:hypothetical protein